MWKETMSNLDDGSVIVTGASRGLGRSMAERFAREGAKVALTARDQDRLEDVAADLPGESLVVPADVRDSEAVEDVVTRTVEEFGGIDTLVKTPG